ncbi:molybdenum cofactor biosynthesis protein B [Pseudomonas sp. NPDC088368]|jgi:molybdenum cofactor biosynthesis protein B|uniref:molybdenum cofactor biosynthesis protein B n=1 Tax=Pseudomonas sp. NPDC088368 TaxID=3364453 RepID=UPI003801AC9F
MGHLAQCSFQSLNIAVLTISDTRTFDTDSSGRTLCERVQTAGHRLIDRQWVRDDVYQIRAALSVWIADPAVQVVLTTGGTGLTPRDNTPQAVLPLLDREVTGFGELFRHVSLAEIGMSSLQSRALAGMSNGVLICCVPGSPGACRTAWDQILREQLDSRTAPCNFVPHLKPLASPTGTVVDPCGVRP